METRKHHDFDLAKEIGRGMKKDGRAWAAFDTEDGMKVVFVESVPRNGAHGKHTALHAWRREETRIENGQERRIIFIVAQGGVVPHAGMEKRAEGKRSPNLLRIEAAVQSLRIAWQRLAEDGIYGVEEAFVFSSHAHDTLSECRADLGMESDFGPGEETDPLDEEIAA